MVVDKHTDKPALIAKIGALGGQVDHEQPGSILLEVTLTGAQLRQVARLDEVLWIDRWSAEEEDMDNSRIQSGSNTIETAAGYTGTGIHTHIYEGLETGHVDWNTVPTNVRSGGGAASHGHCTAGIVFGNGTSAPQARGHAPDAVGFYTNYSTVTAGWSRNAVIGDVVNVHECLWTTASWGNTRTTAYTAISADADDIVFDHRIPWTQSQSNQGNTAPTNNSRPQAWGKNIISVGGMWHQNNSRGATGPGPLRLRHELVNINL